MQSVVSAGLPKCSSSGSLTPRPRFLLFSTKKYTALTRSIASSSPGQYDLGELTRKDFPDGEHYTRLDTPCKGRDVAIIGGTVTDEDTLDVYDLASGVVEGGAHRVIIFVPFFGYATMERAVKTGEVVKAKTRARLLSSIPLPGSGGSIVLLDLHVESISYYFEGSLRPWHLSGRSLILEAVKGAVSEGEEYVIASTDAGRAKIVEGFANDLLVPASFVFKRRLDSGATTVTAVSAQVSGKHVVIYDDMIRTGGSLISAAHAYKDAGASRISVVSTHGVFAGDAVAKLKGSGLIECVIVTDSHPRALEVAATSQGFVRVISIAPLLAAYLDSY